MELKYDRNVILECILDLKDYNEPKLNKVRERLEDAVNEELLQSLTCIATVGKKLGYKTVQKLLKDVSEIVENLESGKTDWKD